MKKTCVIVDANAFVHRSFNGYEIKYNKDGQDNRVLYGLMRVLADLPNQLEEIHYLYLVFDPEDSSLYRRAVFPSYKANRPPHDPELVKQRERAKKVLTYEVGVPLIHFNGYEADDIIASLCKYYDDGNHEIVVVSPDKDLCQLVNENTNILRPVKKDGQKSYQYVSSKHVEEIYGVPPHKIPDYLALVGDTVDNLPGINKMGPKTAKKFLAEFISVDHILALCPQMSGKFWDEIKENQEQLQIVKQLATVKDDLPMTDHVLKALDLANEVQAHIGYQGKMQELIHYYNWPLWFVKPFIEEYETLAFNDRLYNQ